MDFFEFYGLREDPFRLSPDTEYFYPSDIHRVALDSLDYAVENKEGFCLVSGEPGTGKTTALKVFVNKWKERSEIALILTPRLSPEEFLAAVLDELEIAYAGDKKILLLKAFRDFLLEKSLSGRPVIIIVDEAQDLSDETLEELRLLSNLETEKEKLLQIILVGQTGLDERLKSVALKHLDQRIAVRVRLRPLNAQELYRYINHRLLVAGKGYLKMGERVTGVVYGYSKGVPRVINMITSRAIMSAYLERHNVIKARHVRYAIKHIEGVKTAKKGKGIRAVYALAAAAVFILTFMAAISLTPLKEARSVTASVVDGVAALRKPLPMAGIREESEAAGPGQPVEAANGVPSEVSAAATGDLHGESDREGTASGPEESAGSER